MAPRSAQRRRSVDQTIQVVHEPERSTGRIVLNRKKTVDGTPEAKVSKPVLSVIDEVYKPSRRGK
ncbi:hypothetical protein BDN72DRAFT_850902 [Pluteus cervinus]|uniref:Uncharacterized protein n=1 Tax=Pluteus cervinus TaxID=181527 RepID=A0ACD3A3Q4_9AGAR|nr:hypothetical protein BDN72DRAFT_850902 [Pluteus cervinus]